MKLRELLQILTDSENQPHQYVGNPVDLQAEILRATDVFNYSDNAIDTLARKEIADDLFRKAVDRQKEALRAKKKHWFPWRLVLKVEKRQHT